MGNFELKKFYERKRDIFSNPDVFDINYYPEKPIEREEILVILEKVADFMILKIVGNIFITGFHGSGKTLYAKNLFKEIKELSNTEKLNFGVSYVNCRDRTNSDAVVDKIMKDISNNNIPKNKELFKDKLTKDLILFLDEVDELQDPNNLLYYFSRFIEIEEKNQYKVFLIMISNKSEWEESLDQATRSSLALTRIIFKPYTKGQIKDILRQRVKLGIQDPAIITDEFLSIIAKKTLENNSDLRIGLRALFFLARDLEKEGKSILPERRISEIFHTALIDIQRERVEHLDISPFLALVGIMRAESIKVKDIFEIEYRLACREMRISPLGYTMFNRHLMVLEEKGLIHIGKVQEGKIVFKTVKLIVDKKMIDIEYQKRKMIVVKEDNL